jgi:hypothetical protein
VQKEEIVEGKIIMNSFCPFFKEKCKGNECVMWKDDKCLIISLVERLLIYHEKETAERETTKEILEAMKLATDQELAVELLAFAKKLFSYVEDIDLFIASRSFWENKGINERTAPSAIKLKMHNVETLAVNMFEAEMRLMEKEQIEEEKNEKLPPLVDLCVDWAITNGLKSVTQSNIKVFLDERNEILHHETLILLHARVNLKLKSKR